MTEEDVKLLKKLEDKIKELKSKCDEETAKREIAEQALIVANEKMNQAEKRNAELTVKYNNLVDARLLSATEEIRLESKTRINQMVREIDKCLTLIK